MPTAKSANYPSFLGESSQNVKEPQMKREQYEIGSKDNTTFKMFCKEQGSTRGKNWDDEDVGENNEVSEE